MPFAGTIRRLSRRDPVVRALARAWRELTGGTGQPDDARRRTLVACSGGGDSSGLLLGLAAGLSRPGELLVVGHVVHDLRPAAESLLDRDTAAALAEALGLPFFESQVRVRREGGNAEAAARRLRYAALAEMAGGAGCPYLATAHHGEDQLETILMGLLRGAGPRGLAGVAASRRLKKAGVTVIRPALGLSRADLQGLCGRAGWAWREDATNTDQSRLRAALRLGVVPELLRLRPGAAGRAARSAGLLADAAGVVEERAAGLLEVGRASEGFAWERGSLRRERAVVVGATLRRAAAELVGGRGRDRLGDRGIGPAVRAIRDDGTGPRRFGVARLEIVVTARRVELRRKADG